MEKMKLNNCKYPSMLNTFIFTYLFTFYLLFLVGCSDFRWNRAIKVPLSSGETNNNTLPIYKLLFSDLFPKESSLAMFTLSWYF